MSPGQLLRQGADYTRLLAQARNGRLPHGVLICGDRGVGKTTAAMGLASVLLDDPRVMSHAHPAPTPSKSWFGIGTPSTRLGPACQAVGKVGRVLGYHGQASDGRAEPGRDLRAQ